MGNSCSLEFFEDNQEAALDENLYIEHKFDSTELRSRTSRSRSLVDWRNIRMKYEILNEICHSRNKVYILEDRTSKEIYAAKMLIMGYNSFAPRDSIACAFPDLEVPLTLDCPYILKLYQVANEGRHLYLISEYCGGGTLEARIREKGRLSEPIAKNIMYMLLYGVNHMHQNNYIHRDLAPRNILFESKKKSSIIKIIDFDTTKKMCSEVNQRMGDEYYYHYLAPELIKYYREVDLFRNVIPTNNRLSRAMSPRRSSGYCKKVDIWSCGVILYQMLTGELPFSNAFNIERGRLILEGEFWHNISKECIDLLQNMLNQNPKDRYCADLLLKSPWFKGTSESYRSSCSSRMNLLDLTYIRKLNDFQRIILTHISSTTTKFVQWRKLHKSFNTIDKNNDGVISKEELINAYLQNDISIANIDEVFNSIDTDGDGEIQFSEFQAAFTNMSDIPEDCLKSVFDAYDRDHDQFIDIYELGQMFETKDEDFEKKMQALMREIDDDGDGKISFEEFKTYLHSISYSLVR